MIVEQNISMIAFSCRLRLIHDIGSRLIDVAVNNAGYALVGPFEDSSMDETKAPFETNLSEPVRSYVMQAPTNPLSVFTKPQI